MNIDDCVSSVQEWLERRRTGISKNTYIILPTTLPFFCWTKHWKGHFLEPQPFNILKYPTFAYTQIPQILHSEEYFFSNLPKGGFVVIGSEQLSLTIAVCSTVHQVAPRITTLVHWKYLYHYRQLTVNDVVL